MSIAYSPKINKTIKQQKNMLEMLAWMSCTPLVVGFFLNKGFQVFDVTQLIDDLGRLTGLLAINVMLIQVILVSRIELLDALYGQDTLVAVHKKLNKPAYYLLSIHFAALLWAYSVKDNVSVLAEYDKMWDWQDTQWAIISFIIISVIVVVSGSAIRKILPYEVWYVIHLTIYVALIISIPHVFSTGTDMQDFWTKMYMISLYIITVSGLLVYRFLLPLYRSFRHNLVVSNVVRESDNSVSIYMTGRNLDKLPHLAGQFFMWRFMSRHLFFNAHPYSLSAAPDGKTLRITVADLGNGSHKLQRVEKGTRVWFEGPYGIFTEERRTKDRVTMIASGVGITPIRALTEAIDFGRGDLTIIYRGQRETKMPFLNELETLAEEKGINLIYSVGKRARSTSWLAHETAPSPMTDLQAILNLVPDIADNDVYVCGPVAWTHTVLRTLHKADVPDSQIHAEEFAW